MPSWQDLAIRRQYMLPSKWLFLPIWVVYLLVLVAFEVLVDVLAKQFASLE